MNLNSRAVTIVSKINQFLAATKTKIEFPAHLSVSSYNQKTLSTISNSSINSIKTNCMGTMASSSSAHPKNRLQHEKSPYLLQHQSNPVDWYPWSEEAFAVAKKRNKPIFLSVGYSTCHWCHVMERESFENPEIAKIMNSCFVNIKMDREERPDIDKIYMTFVQAISGSGGWPMSVWMTPDLKPIYGGTYYPPEDRYFGRPGFRALLQTIYEQWTENEGKCHESGEKIMGVLQRSAELPASDHISPAEGASGKCIQQLTRSYEPTFGGFSDHPKFPQPVNLMFLIDWALKNQEDPNRFSIIKMIERTMKEMAKGGIHDHLGQGFARYSTDKKWHVPHFEKMLYDQAQLTVAYSNAYLLLKEEFYSEIVQDILTYVGRDLSHPEGGFYSAEDADSYATFDSKEKKEGAFYVWKNSEIDEILGDKSLANGATFAEVFKFRYGVKENGNVDPYNDPHEELKEQNVIFEAHTIDDTGKKFKVSSEDVNAALEEAKTVLFNYRNVNRPRPGLDTKFVTSWNGLMISGYARAGTALNKPEYIERAIKAMEFLRKYVIKKELGFDLLRSCYRDEETQGVINLKTPIFGCVDDFANLVSASIELFHATFEPEYLQQAIKLQEKQDELFWDTELGGYFTSRAGDPSVIVRMKDDDDGAEPSSNSTAVLNLIRLHSITQVKEYKQKSEMLFKQFSDRLSKVPITLPVMTSALTSYSAPGPISILITGQDIKNHDVVKQLRSQLLPAAASVTGIDFSKPESVNLLKTLLPKLSGQLSQPTKETKAFVKKGDSADAITISTAADWAKIF